MVAPKNRVCVEQCIGHSASVFHAILANPSCSQLTNCLKQVCLIQNPGVMMALWWWRERVMPEDLQKCIEQAGDLSLTESDCTKPGIVVANVLLILLFAGVGQASLVMLSPDATVLNRTSACTGIGFLTTVPLICFAPVFALTKMPHFLKWTPLLAIVLLVPPCFFFRPTDLPGCVIESCLSFSLCLWTLIGTGRFLLQK